MVEYTQRVASAVDDWIKVRVQEEANKRKVTESTYIRDLLSDFYITKSLLESGNRITEDVNTTAEMAGRTNNENHSDRQPNRYHSDGTNGKS